MHNTRILGIIWRNYFVRICVSIEYYWRQLQKKYIETINYMAIETVECTK